MFKEGKVTDQFRFKIKGGITTVTGKPIKSLGKVFYSTLSDKQCVKEMEDQTRDMMEKVEEWSARVIPTASV